MKVVFLSGSRSNAAGGIFEVERAVSKLLIERHGISIEAAGLLDEGTKRDSEAWGPTPTYCFPRLGPKSFGYSPKLRNWVFNSQYDILHLHNLWMYVSVLALKWHRKFHRPFVVSPHGMLDAWALKNSGLKKRIAAALYERAMLREAGVIHAFHEKDVADIRSYGLRNPVAVIPNGVHLPASNSPSVERTNRLLFLGRIHPKKGIAELIAAWARLDDESRNGWRLSIAGWDDGGHLEGLRRTVIECGLQDSIEFCGPVYGDAKNKLLQSSSGFILPSFSEGLPMTVLEAWSHSLPVLMTDECNLPVGFSVKAARRIESNAESIAFELRSFFKLSLDRRLEMGTNGRKLVQDSFTWDKISNQYASVYRWLHNGGDRPSCLQFFQ